MILIPVTQREYQIVKTLGDNDWIVVERRESVSCLNHGPGVLIKKANHIRWVKPEQIKEEY